MRVGAKEAAMVIALSLTVSGATASAILFLVKQNVDNSSRYAELRQQVAVLNERVKRMDHEMELIRTLIERYIASPHASNLKLPYLPAPGDEVLSPPYIALTDNRRLLLLP